MATVINAGRFSSGNATQLQSIPVLQQTPTPGQVLKADAQSNWAPGTDSDSANAVTLQGRAISAADPDDGNKLGWNDNLNRWEPSPDNNSTDCTHIRNIEVDATAPTATNTTLVYDSATSKYVADLGAAIVDDGLRAYLKEDDHNLGVGTGSAGGLPGKIVAHNTGAGIDTRVVIESESSHTALHLRSNDSSDAAVGDRYAQVQFWNENSNKAQVHYDPEDRELVYVADGTANSGKGMSIRDDGRTGFHITEKISNFTIKTIADTATLVGMDGGVITTNVSTATLTANNPGSVASGFLKLIGEGDRVSVSTAPNDFATVIDVVSDTVLTLDGPIGDGSAVQTISIKRAIAGFVDTANETQFLIKDNGRVGIGTNDPDRRLHIKTQAGEGNSSIIVESPDDQAVISLRAQTGATPSGGNDPAMNFKVGTGGGEKARIRYYGTKEQFGLVLTDTPTTDDFVVCQTSDRGSRFGIRQEEFVSGLSSKGLEAGTTLKDTSNPGVDYVASLGVGTSFTPIAPGPISGLSKVLACGDRVAVSATLPAADSDYVEVLTCTDSAFTTAANTGAVGGALNIYIKPAQLRLEKQGATQETSLVVDSEGRGRFGVTDGGLDGTLNVNGYVSLSDENVLTAPPLDDAGAVQDVTKLYFQKGNGNDADMRCLLHFDTDGPHGFLSDAGFGATQRHTITNKPGLVDVNGVVVDNSTTKFGSGSAYFGGDSYLNIDEMFGGGTDFDPNAGHGYSWSFWLNLQTATGTIQPLTGVYYSANKWSHLVFDEAADTLYLKQDFADATGARTSASVGPLGISSGATPIGMGTWFYLAIVYEKSSNKLYVFINGALIGSDTLTAAAPYAFVDAWKNTAIRIGFDEGYSNSKIKGNIDEIAYSAKVRHTSAFTNPTEAFRATGLYAWSGGLSQPYRLQPVGS